MKIEKHMTASVHSVGRAQSLSVAHEMMRKYQIRHLPVLEGGKLVGIVTERDLHLLETLRDVDPDAVPVEEAMSAEVYAVTPDDPLAEVVRTMSERKYGSAVVMRGTKVVGLFTTTDALRLLATLTEERKGGFF